MVPENIHTPTTEGHWKFRGGGGLKGQNFKGKYEPKPEFPEGGGSNQKPSMGGVWICSGTTQLKIQQ